MAVIIHDAFPERLISAIVFLFSRDLIKGSQGLNGMLCLPAALVGFVEGSAGQSCVQPVAGDHAFAEEIVVFHFPLLADDVFSGFQIFFLAGFLVKQCEGVTDGKIHLHPVLSHKSVALYQKICIDLIRGFHGYF